MPVDGVEDVVKLVGPSGFLESQAELSFQEKDGDGLHEQKPDKHSKGGGNVMAGVVAVRRSGEVVDVRASRLVSVPVGVGDIIEKKLLIADKSAFFKLSISKI